MSLKPLCPTPAALDKFTYKEFKGGFFKAIRKMAKKHNSQETAAPFFLNIKQKFADSPEDFFMVFGKMNAWKKHAKETATKEDALRGLCYVTYDEAAKNLVLHIMPVAGKLKAKETLVAKAMKKAVPPARCSPVFEKGDFSEEMLEKLAAATENMEETPDDENADALEEKVATLREQALAAAKQAASPKEAKQILLVMRDIEDIENYLERMATVTSLKDLKAIDDKVRAIFAKYMGAKK